MRLNKIDVWLLALVFPPQRKGEPWHVLFRFFVPKENMEERIKRDRVPYDEWERAGAIYATQGNVLSPHRGPSPGLSNGRRYEK